MAASPGLPRVTLLRRNLVRKLQATAISQRVFFIASPPFSSLTGFFPGGPANRRQYTPAP